MRQYEWAAYLTVMQNRHSRQVNGDYTQDGQMSMPKNAPIGLAKSSLANSRKFSPCSYEAMP